MATPTKADPLKCQLCLEPYKEPFLLPCLHSFCKKCLVAESERQGASENKFQCPSCKSGFNVPPGGVTALPQDLALARQVEMLTIEKKLVSGVSIPCDRCVKQIGGSAIVYCCQCACFLCSSCKDSHQSWRPMVGHELVEVGNKKKGTVKLEGVQQSSVYCSQHPDEKLKFYCKECEILSCRDCLVFSHKDHKIRPYEELLRKGSEELRDSLNNSKPMLKKLERATIERKNVMKKVKSRKMIVDDEINKAFFALSEAVNQRWKAALDECEELEHRKLTVLSMQLEEFDNLKDVCSYTETALETHKPFELLASKKLIKNRISLCNESCKKEIIELKEDDIIYTSFNTSALLKEIKYFGLILGVDSSMSHLDTGITIPLATVNVERKFTVLVKDSKGKHASSRALITASLKNITSEKGSDKVVAVKITRDSNNFTLSCIPPSQGEYHLSVIVGRKEVKYSPFRFWANKRNPYTNNNVFIAQDKLTGVNTRQAICGGAQAICGGAQAICCGGVAVSADGNVYVSVHDTYNTFSCIKVFNKDGLFKEDIGSFGSEKRQFNKPSKLMILNDVLYVIDTGNNRIQRISLSGKYLGEFQCPGTPLFWCQNNRKGTPTPTGITHDGKGHVIVCDSSYGVHMFNGNGNHLSRVDCRKPPIDIAVDNDGIINILVEPMTIQDLNYYNKAFLPVSDVQPECFEIQPIQETLGGLKMVYVQVSSNSLQSAYSLVIDHMNNRIITGTNPPNQYNGYNNSPMCICVVDCQNNNYVELIQLGGYKSTGNGVYDLALDKNGFLYVADSVYNRVLRL